MQYEQILYSNHAVKQLFLRDISTNEIEYVLQNGETIIEYPDDKPYSSKILLSFCNKRPLHIVRSYIVDEKAIVIITAYEPS
ncbi:MAG: DUF4258 domain-containing protein [Bacteroidales bacterium]|nr:DUF4258 domain-containing protein [Bacteroidales bacterium]